MLIAHIRLNSKGVELPVAQCVSVGATKHIDLLRDNLCRELKQLEKNGLKVKLVENPAGTFTFLACQVTNTDNSLSEDHMRTLLRQVLTNIISDLILNHWEQVLLKDIIRENYYYFNDMERDTIFYNAMGYVHNDHYSGSHHLSIYQLARKNHIINKLNEFLCSNNRIIIEGFIKFRLKDYIGDLQGIVDRAVDDFLLDREYQEFIQLLKYFVDIQEPKLEVINVMLKPCGTFKLYDGNNQPVNSDFLEGFVVELINSEINYEDLLISALITLAPRRIVFHFTSDGQLVTAVDTIKMVFTGRVSHCQGCSLCRDMKT